MPISGLFILLAVIGVVSVVRFSFQLTERVLDNTPEKKKLEDIVLPVVMFDPPPFEKVEDIDPVQMLRFSLWSALTGEGRSSYVYGENGELIVPARDLGVAAARLFGPEVELQHQTFNDAIETTYYYDEKNNVYNVPVMAQLYVYYPSVRDIQRDGDYYNVIVDYIPPSSAWTAGMDGGRNQPPADKSMVYVMRKVGSGYQIAALRDMPSDTVPTEQPPGGYASGTQSGNNP